MIPNLHWLHRDQFWSDSLHQFVTIHRRMNRTSANPSATIQLTLRQPFVWWLNIARHNLTRDKQQSILRNQIIMEIPSISHHKSSYLTQLWPPHLHRRWMICWVVLCNVVVGSLRLRRTPCNIPTAELFITWIKERGYISWQVPKAPPNHLMFHLGGLSVYPFKLFSVDYSLFAVRWYQGNPMMDK